jgi:PAS domain S-box-containing protein
MALEKQNEEYRLLFDSNPCPMYVCEAETLTFVAVNQAAIDHYGYSREEFLEMSTLEMRTTDDVPALLGHITRQSGAYLWFGIVEAQKEGRLDHRC